MLMMLPRMRFRSLRLCRTRLSLSSSRRGIGGTMPCLYRPRAQYRLHAVEGVGQPRAGWRLAGGGRVAASARIKAPTV